MNKLNRWGSHILLIFAVVCLASCSDDPDSFKVEPSKQDWASVKNSTLAFMMRRPHYLNVQDPEKSMQIDFFEKSGQHFVVLLSMETNDEIRVYKYLGRALRNDVYLREFGTFGESFHGKDKDRYLNLRNTDSLWSLIGDNWFWLNSAEWKLIERVLKGKAKYHDHEYDETIVVFHFKESKLEGTHDSVLPFDSSMAQKLDVLVNEETETMEVALESSDGVITRDLVVVRGKWFALSVSLGDDSLVQNSLMVGFVTPDSIVYRYLGKQGRVLSQNTMRTHRRKRRTEMVWSYFGYGKWWLSEESMESLFNSCVTSTPSEEEQTHSLHLDLLFVE